MILISSFVKSLLKVVLKLDITKHYKAGKRSIVKDIGGFFRELIK